MKGEGGNACISTREQSNHTEQAIPARQRGRNHLELGEDYTILIMGELTSEREDV